ncbi:hypothetical protein [Candidatus Enterococcus clewellii]|uniref:Uncharacterized protein n=1 Tax=Candidatus Enterococcus clewellii TaxID=1834193 RepID=A0A242K676_9ENTE|nr:hypothetical protein [Enterococcus sp. 9E7_DIV0242]OTP15810.1 hypothetical protein A5888_002024 [Enterococcus sp. 9E7_DIV0242]
MDRGNIRVGGTYLCSSDYLSWSFIGRAVSMGKYTVKVELLKCHPSDRLALDSDNPVLKVNYLSVLDAI